MPSQKQNSLCVSRVKAEEDIRGGRLNVLSYRKFPLKAIILKDSLSRISSVLKKGGGNNARVKKGFAKDYGNE